MVRAALTSHGLVSAAWSGSTLYWVTARGSVHWLQGDQVETLDTSGISEARVVEVVCTQGQVTVLTSSGELWTLDTGDTRLNLVTGLLARRVTQVAGGKHHLAAVTDQGQVFTWTEDSVNPVQVKLVSVTLSIISRPQLLRWPLL